MSAARDADRDPREDAFPPQPGHDLDDARARFATNEPRRVLRIAFHGDGARQASGCGPWPAPWPAPRPLVFFEEDAQGPARRLILHPRQRA